MALENVAERRTVTEPRVLTIAALGSRDRLIQVLAETDLPHASVTPVEEYGHRFVIGERHPPICGPASHARYLGRAFGGRSWNVED